MLTAKLLPLPLAFPVYWSVRLSRCGTWTSLEIILLRGGPPKSPGLRCPSMPIGTGGMLALDRTFTVSCAIDSKLGRRIPATKARGNYRRKRPKRLENWEPSNFSRAPTISRNTNLVHPLKLFSPLSINLPPVTSVPANLRLRERCSIIGKIVNILSLSPDAQQTKIYS